MMADKFMWKLWKNWCDPVLRFKDITKDYRQRNGTIMFPSSHNIDRQNVLYAKQILKKLLPSGNRVLIVLKPEPGVVNHLCETFKRFRNQIEFRFTITTLNSILRLVFEPQASRINERIRSVRIALEWGYATSVSIEPFLDDSPIPLIERLLSIGLPPEKMWIGPMNHLTILGKKSAIIRQYLDYLQTIYSPYNLKAIYRHIGGRGWNINYKDGFYRQMRKH
jgi:hypothetical protein